MAEKPQILKPINGFIALPIPPQIFADILREYKIGLVRKPPIDQDLENFVREELDFLAADEAEFVEAFSIPDEDPRPAIRFITSGKRWCDLTVPVFEDSTLRCTPRLYAEGEEPVCEKDVEETLRNIAMILHAEASCDKMPTTSA